MQPLFGEARWRQRPSRWTKGRSKGREEVLVDDALCRREGNELPSQDIGGEGGRRATLKPGDGEGGDIVP